MRDPIFYRWHTFIDSIFAKFKNTLAPYSTNELTFEGIHVQSVNVRLTTRSSNTTPNVLLTYWQKSDVDLGAGLDFGPGNVYAQVSKMTKHFISMAEIERGVSIFLIYIAKKRSMFH